jgi:hemin uptake protein HemP
MTSTNRSAGPGVEARARAEPAAPQPIDSSTLLGPRQEVQIRHHGAIYTLRQTRQGKLILTK